MQNQGEPQKNEQSFITIPAAEDPKRLLLLKKAALIVTIILAFFAVVAIVMASMGYMKVSFGTTSTIVQGSSSSVCNLSVINEYNSLVSVPVANNEERLAANQKVQDFAKNIESKDGADSDATCLFIVYAAALAADDKSKATTYVKKVETLASKGVFVDTRLNGVTSIKQMQGTVQVITPSENGLQGAG